MAQSCLVHTFSLILFLALANAEISHKRAADQCNVDSRTDCHTEAGATESKCLNRGCCWRPPADGSRVVPWCYLPVSSLSSGHCHVNDIHREDCYPESGATQATCLSRGCCWSTSSIKGVPWCYHNSDVTGYVLSNVVSTATGKTGNLHRDRPSRWPVDVADLKLDVKFETNNRLHFKIYDPNVKRFEVPLETPSVDDQAPHPEYDVAFKNSPFGILVIRKSTGTILFDSSYVPLTFADQYIEITTTLPTKYIYGLGERRHQMWLNPDDSMRFPLWTRDQGLPKDTNLYGVHPFYLGMEEDGNAFGVFLLNSNAMEVELLPTTPMTLQYRTIGGILDFYVYTGPSPDDVIRQHSEVIGKTFMPPYWALGYNLCRWGYNNDHNLKAVIDRMRQLQIPYETQWNDIDYMKDKLDFTYDKQNFADLPNIVDDLHNHGQRYVVILDPGISSEQPAGTYPPYDDGVKEDIFIKTHDGSQILIGKVWPGLTAFPDFTHPKIIDYWTRHVRSLYNQLPFDGLWIDMNEPANFVEGSNTGCTDNSLDKPPYTPWIADGNLATKTLCPSARQNLSSHYNLHSMYGYFEAKATFEALKRVRQLRSLVISRSTFPGSGMYGGHWEGDNNAQWSDMYYSIPALMNANMYGIPLMGSDICGFGGFPTEELCVRWTQLGSFYTFMRNHRDFNTFDQDPASAVFQESQHILKSAVEFRYRLLPYLYTLFFQSHTKGTPVIRPIFFQYPADKATFVIDRQFMWGSGLLISPVLEDGARTVNAYFPTDKWYDAYTGKEVANTGQNVTLSAPLEKINVHVRGGTVIPMQEHAVTTAASVGKNFKLIIAPSEAGIAAGDLFVDDGEALDAISGMKYILLHFTATRNELRSTVQVNGLQRTMTLGEITVFGISENPRQVLVNGKHSAHTYDSNNKVLNIQHIQIDMLSPIHATWS